MLCSSLGLDIIIIQPYLRLWQLISLFVYLCSWNLPGPENYALQYTDGVQTYITESVSNEYIQVTKCIYKKEPVTSTSGKEKHLDQLFRCICVLDENDVYPWISIMMLSDIHRKIILVIKRKLNFKAWSFVGLFFTEDSVQAIFLFFFYFSNFQITLLPFPP